MQYKIYHIPNPPHKGFEFAVQSIEEAKDALNILAYLDLDGREHLAHNYGTDQFRLRLIDAYKAYGRKRGINAAWLIDTNIQGLLQKSEEWPEWEDWTNDDGEFIDEVLRNEQQ